MRQIIPKSQTPKHNFFTSFKSSITSYSLPEKFTFPFEYTPHPLCLLAAKELQAHIGTQQEWEHNFGLIPDKKGTIIGKMFGVLLVKNEQKEIGYLSAFSGKLAGGNHHPKFVPPVFDGLKENGFLNNGMKKLSQITQQIDSLKASQTNDIDFIDSKIELLKTQRKNLSIHLQNQLFDNYHFLNQFGDVKSLRTIFEDVRNQKPPSGAGECAAPKLLQYAFQHNMKPLAIAEFWWGLSPKSDFWKHGHFYPVCREKCEPILGHMLEGIELDDGPIN